MEMNLKTLMTITKIIQMWTEAHIPIKRTFSQPMIIMILIKVTIIIGIGKIMLIGLILGLITEILGQIMVMEIMLGINILHIIR